MLEFQNKKKFKRILYSPLTLIALMVVLIVLGKATWNVYQKERLSFDHLERQKSELEKLALREKNLAQAIDYLKTDEGVEAEIRSKFRFAREGESIAVIIDPNASTAEIIAPVTQATTSPGFWKRVFGWFDN